MPRPKRALKLHYGIKFARCAVGQAVFVPLASFRHFADNIGPRQIFWNFVSSRPERIQQAKKDWREMRFTMIAGDDEFIPLPD